MMIVELKKENGNRIFVEAYEVNESNDKIVVYPQDPVSMHPKRKYKKNNYKYIKIKNPSGQDSFLKEE